MPPRKRKARGRRPRRPVRWRLLLAASCLAVVAIAAYVGYLDWEVRRRFEGKRWALPARVYARPLELYAGSALSPDELERELSALRYRPQEGAGPPGTFARDGDVFRLRTRAFDFPDGSEPSRDLTIAFSRGGVADVRRADTGEAVALARLDPLAFASIYPAHQEDRTLVRLEQVPPVLLAGLMAVEDRAFRTHRGVDPRAVLRALVANLRAGAVVQGGSTLTQQLVKNFYLTSERTLARKVNEAIMALLLEWHYGKDEILEAYCNEVYLGQDGKRSIHGFGLASAFYFERPLEELDVAQVALLLALVRGPSQYDPRRHPRQARERRDLVLDVMASRGAAGAAEVRQAKARPLGVTADPPSGVTRYPAFLDLVRRQLSRDYREEDLRTEGLRVFTTLDPGVQLRVQAVMAGRLARLEASRGLPEDSLEAAALLADPRTGEVLAAVGGRRFEAGGFNRAIDAVRPIGSLVKPAVYLAALAQPERYTLATVVEDSPVRVETPSGPWEPRNFDRTFRGPVLLYQALANSYNAATVRVGLDVGLEPVLDTLVALGVERRYPAYPSVLLGAVEMTPLEVTQMYQTLAAGGFRTPLRTVRDVLDAEGRPVQRYSLSVERALDPAVVHLVDAALEIAVREGTGRPAREYLPEGFAAAGKTGTTDDLRDSWFAGFTQDRLGVVWIGTDDNSPTGLTGATGALPLWSEVMAGIRAVPLSLGTPEGIETARVDPRSGERASGWCGDCVELPFLEGTAPRHPSSEGFRKAVDWVRGLF